MALTYEKGQSAYQQFFADEAAQIYATVKDHPVDRDSYADVKAFLDRYAKDYQGQEDAMAGLKVKVGSQEMTFAEVIAALTAQADKQVRTFQMHSRQMSGSAIFRLLLPKRTLQM